MRGEPIDHEYNLITLAADVIHTVGPHGENPDALASCYLRSLELARGYGLRTIAFCCISTGKFGYPIVRAAHVALATVRDWLGRRRFHR